jgi:hypothetical protein
VCPAWQLMDRRGQGLRGHGWLISGDFRDV